MANYQPDTGLNLLETLTTGMYPDSLVIFREYIQNACDAIDDAVKFRILNADNGKIDIRIKPNKRIITIQDNGTGIPASKFKLILGGIAVANKILGSDNRGFRGIGKLCGLAYCRELRFVSTVKDEDIESTMIWHAAELREKFYTDKNYGLEVLNEIIEFESKSGVDPNEHFFRVEMIDIVYTDKNLLDAKKVIDYLSFVAPVEYDSAFGFQKEIHDYAAGLNCHISEYNISVNGEQLCKPYKTTFSTSVGSDDIFDLEFRDFRDSAGNLIAWSWVGLSMFKGVIAANENMRGLRLRVGNLQLGGWNALVALFKEQRGTKFFIGEVHAVDTNLKPDAQRDYFAANTARKMFEKLLGECFKELHAIYHAAADVRTEQNKINAPAKAEAEFSRQSTPYKKNSSSRIRRRNFDVEESRRQSLG